MDTGLLPLDAQMKKGVGSGGRAGAAEIRALSIHVHTWHTLLFCGLNLGTQGRQ